MDTTIQSYINENSGDWRNRGRLWWRDRVEQLWMEGYKKSLSHPVALFHASFPAWSEEEFSIVVEGWRRGRHDITSATRTPGP